MAGEEFIINLISNNLIGVLFGILMYRMANGSIKDMANSIKELIIEIKTKK